MKKNPPRWGIFVFTVSFLAMTLVVSYVFTEDIAAFGKDVLEVKRQIKNQEEHYH